MKTTFLDVKHAITAALLATTAFSVTCEASVVDFQAKFSLSSSDENGTNICAFGSACAAAFEQDTGLHLVESLSGNWSNIVGTLNFSFDTDSNSVLPGANINLFDSPIATIFAVSSINVTPWLSGHGLFLGFDSAAFSVSRNLPMAFRGPISGGSDLASAATTAPNTFPFRDAGISSRIDSATPLRWSAWIVPDRFGVVSVVPEPSTLVLLAPAAFFLLRNRRKSVAVR